uniref:Uncharacterized protein n=1 Tax=Manihot esculenta TaxID=3983 RepID=A0A199U9H6_MANES
MELVAATTLRPRTTLRRPSEKLRKCSSSSKRDLTHQGIDMQKQIYYQTNL